MHARKIEDFLGTKLRVATQLRQRVSFRREMQRPSPAYQEEVRHRGSHETLRRTRALKSIPESSEFQI